MNLQWRSIRGLLCFAVVFATTGLWIEAQTAPPSTPAGQTLQAFLEAFNNGDLSKVEAYVKEYGSPQPAGGLQMFSSQTGGFDLLSIRTSAPDAITFMVKCKGDHPTAFGSLRLASTQPPR